MAVAPFVSLCVIPFAFSRMLRRVHRAAVSKSPTAPGDGPAHGQIEEARRPPLRTAPVRRLRRDDHALRTDAHERRSAHRAANAGTGALTVGLTGFVFNLLLIVRAPLQLFQAIQTSILPHLDSHRGARLDAEFRRTIRSTSTDRRFAGAVALGLLAVGPTVMPRCSATRASYAASASRCSGSGWACT